MVLLCCIGIAARTVAGLVGAATFQMVRCFLRFDGLEDYGVACSPLYMRPFSCARKCLGSSVIMSFCEFPNHLVVPKVVVTVGPKSLFNAVGRWQPWI